MKSTGLLLACAAMLLLSACRDDKQEIEDVAYHYLYATANYLIDDAMPYASKETRENTLPIIRDKLIPLTDTNYIKANQPASVAIDNINITGDTAWVDYTKTTPIKTVSSQVCVVKEDGKWLVYAPLR